MVKRFVPSAVAFVTLLLVGTACAQAPAQVPPKGAILFSPVFSLPQGHSAEYHLGMINVGAEPLEGAAMCFDIDSGTPRGGGFVLLPMQTVELGGGLGPNQKLVCRVIISIGKPASLRADILLLTESGLVIGPVPLR